MFLKGQCLHLIICSTKDPHFLCSSSVGSPEVARASAFDFIAHKVQIEIRKLWSRSCHWFIFQSSPLWILKLGPETRNKWIFDQIRRTQKDLYFSHRSIWSDQLWWFVQKLMWTSIPLNGQVRDLLHFRRLFRQTHLNEMKLDYQKWKLKQIFEHSLLLCILWLNVKGPFTSD